MPGDASRLKAQTHMYYSFVLSGDTRGGGNNEHFPRAPPLKSKAFSEDYKNFICSGAPEKPFIIVRINNLIRLDVCYLEIRIYFIYYLS